MRGVRRRYGCDTRGRNVLRGIALRLAAPKRGKENEKAVKFR